MVTTIGKHLNLLLDNLVCIPHTDCKKSETITRVGTKVKIIFISVTGKFIDFPVCVIRNIFIRKLSHLTISSPFILINQKMDKNHSSF